MKRLSENIDKVTPTKKYKITKEEKKLLRKEALKLKTNENRKNKIISDYYQGEFEYFFQNGFRQVHPYFYTFQCNIKERWLNKSVKQVFESDFYPNNSSFIKSQIEHRNLLINNVETTLEYVLKASDVITHRVHRHELPVLDEPIRIIHESDTILVVCKPSSIPVHSYYLAVVNGKFNGATEEPIECEAPLGILCQKVGLSYIQSVEDGGKIASTKFMFLKYDEGKNLSLVLCKPLTGRTHQIRVHLQYLGFPISNDPLYNCTSWGKDKGKNGVYHKSKEQLIKDLMANHEVSIQRFFENGNSESLQRYKAKDNSIVSDDASNKYFQADCEECLSQFSFNENVENFILFLHAYRYRTIDKDWDYKTNIPNWAEDFAVCSDDKEALVRKIEFLTSSDCDIFN